MDLPPEPALSTKPFSRASELSPRVHATSIGAIIPISPGHNDAL